MKLNLGCCDRIVPGYIGVDIALPCDVVADLSKRWPWQDSSISTVLAYDVFEHLPDKRHSMNELWRVLHGGGQARIEVPSAAKGAGAFQDPTHVSYWTANDFEYYEVGNYARERFRNHYGIMADFRILSLEETMYRARWNEVWKVSVVLEAVK